MGNSLACGDLSQVYLLLKVSEDGLKTVCQYFHVFLQSSDFVRHDLVMPFEGCVDPEASKEEMTAAIKYYLVLKRYTDINPGHEFR